VSVSIKHRAGALLAGLLLGVASASEQAASYEPGEPVSGEIRIWGPKEMESVVQAWARGFERHHSGTRVALNLMGTATAMPGLYSGRADIALLGRENDITDDNGFGRVKGYRPQRFELMTGSLASSGKASALVVFVHRDNPLASLTLTELAAVIGCDPSKAASAVRTWGQLGLTGDWANQPINVHTYDASTNTGLFLTRAVLGGSRKMNWERLREYRDVRGKDGAALPAQKQSVDALRADRFGLAIASLEFADRKVKPLALAAAAGQKPVAATRESVIARTYPLTRRTFAFVDVPPGSRIEPRVREFLRYALSADGQADVASQKGYLPLNDEIRAAQQTQLRGLSTP